MFLQNQSRVIEVKVNVYSVEGKPTDEIELPGVFESQVRHELVQKAFRSISLSLRQPYGSYPFAGMRRVGQNVGPNHGISRVPRVAGGSRGVLLASFVGGKSAHSPRSDKILYKKINKKERIMARFSAIAMTRDRNLVVARGHKVPEDLTLPVVVKDDLESIKKTSQAKKLLLDLGLYQDVERAINGKKIRAGRGKARNRKYRIPKSVLVVGTDLEKLRPFRTIAGVETATINSLGLRKLAPGGKGGRLTIFTESAIRELGKVTTQ